jgi:hypothetical protein
LTKVSKRLAKLGVGLLLLAVLGFLFLRSVRGSRAEPYTIARDDLGPWSLAAVSGAGPNEPMLILRPPSRLVSGLFGQLFRRAMESMGEPPVPGIPLVLQGELTRALIDHPALTPEALLAAAHEAGLDAVAPKPLCIGHRRASGGRDRAQLFFAIFDLPALGQFRQHLAARWNNGTGPNSFDPALLSPVLIMATVESTIQSWMPVSADPKVDCLAPIAISSTSQ